MVRSVIYCPEQIAVPETFPNILKTYAKAVIRTQPYDLLRWSAAYFRCLAQNEFPPAKCRLEKDYRCGSITKGYLKVLLEQVGRGFFISREILQQKWEGLCLPEEELFKYLSVCRMLNWPQIHWLKVYTIMVGSLNDSPLQTMNMLCELLTEDVEGAPARIPIWMLIICYTFLSELDCSEEQHFVNGRKMLKCGDFEPEIQMDKIPKVVSSDSFRQALMSECLKKCGNVCECPSVDTAYTSSSGTSAIGLTSEFEFVGSLQDPYKIIKRFGDFNSLVLLLGETKGTKLRDYKGPHNISTKNIEYAKTRQQQVALEREKQALFHDENARKYLHEENLTLLREVGPPWSWLQQFLSAGCVNKSYNFVEEGSIASDVTPTESSDESVYFGKEKDLTSDSETTLISSTTDSDDITKISASESSRFTKETMKQLYSTLRTAEEKGKIDPSRTSSITTFLNQVEVGVLFRAGTETNQNYFIEILQQILKYSQEQHTIFRSIEEVMHYLMCKYKCFVETKGKFSSSRSSESFSYSFVDGEDILQEEFLPLGESYGPSTEAQIESDDRGDFLEMAKKADEEGSKKASADSDNQSFGNESVQEEQGVSADSLDESNEGEVESEDKELLSGSGKSITDTEELPKKDSLRSILDQIQLDNDTCKSSGSSGGSSESFIGHKRKHPEAMELGYDGDAIPDGSSITATIDGTSINGYISDDSSIPCIPQVGTCDGKVCDTEFINSSCIMRATKGSLPKLKIEFVCTIPPLPGVGAPVSKKTIDDFINYVKLRSRSQMGMVMPRNFKEEKCPYMIDVLN